MSETGEIKTEPHLTARELLSARGICSRLIDEYNQVSRVLPRTGVKLFEPNGSWLQNKQIETCLVTRKDFMKVERVNRLSSLAVAEWLPDEKRAKVIKRSGVEWNNYGSVIHGNLYLIPEEALLLLELNCLELQYNGLPLSVQQAYELLLIPTNADCSLSEYRVFSQLARLGYRLQRFQYEKSTNERLEERMQPKKKVIIDPENGRWMGKVSDVSPSVSDCTYPERHVPKRVREDVREIMDDIVDQIEVEVSAKLADTAGEQNVEVKVKNKPRVEIVSEETVVDPVKLVVSPSKDSSCATDSKIIKWSGARIQRNVKLLPKRMDKKVHAFSSAEVQKLTTTSQTPVPPDNGVSKVEKRKSKRVPSPPCKMPKQEIIELSDDDVQEIPKSMTRMEMLNCIPNIASENFIVQTVSRGYIPHSIKPQKSVYEYDRVRLSRMREGYKNFNILLDPSTSEHDSLNSHTLGGNSIMLSPNSRTTLDPSLGGNNFRCIHQHENSSREDQNLHHSSRASHVALGRNRRWNSNAYNHNYMMDSHWDQYMANSWSSFQVNVFRSIAMVGFALRYPAIPNRMLFNGMMCSSQQYYHRNDPRRQSFHGNFPLHPFHRPRFNVRATAPAKLETEKMQSNNDTRYQASFLKLPAESWSELKKKWKESKTITIEDEDDKMDCSEVEVVQRNIQPLVNSKNVKNFVDVYDRLGIIKPAQTKTVRKKKGEYKISYKVYSNTQHYRKSDPGVPMFHLVITRRANIFLQPVDLNRLRQDLDCPNILFAYVSDTSVSYVQADLVSLPNLTDKLLSKIG